MGKFDRKKRKERIQSLLSREKQEELRESEEETNINCTVEIPTESLSSRCLRSFFGKAWGTFTMIQLFGITIIIFFFLVLVELNTKTFRNLNGVVFKEKRYIPKDKVACEWKQPAELTTKLSEDVTGVAIVGYPESGMRLVWRIMEAYTGYVVGDEWDFSRLNNWPHLIALKTSYPHPEGGWTWGNAMKYSIFSIRSPLNVFRAFASMKYELGGSQNESTPPKHTLYAYSTGATLEFWKTWRDENLDTEIDRYSSMIDFWTMNGYTQNTSESIYTDPHCVEDMPSCTPVSFIEYQALEDGAATGYLEAEKISHILKMAGTNVTSQHARRCLYDEILSRTYLYEKNRENCPDLSEYQYTAKQLKDMLEMLNNLIFRYNVPPWTGEKHTIELVQILKRYVSEVEAESLSNVLLEVSELSSSD